jgi:hypothetical protein
MTRVIPRQSIFQHGVPVEFMVGPVPRSAAYL